MTNEEKANEIKANDVCCVWNGGCPNVYNAAMEMAEWKREQMIKKAVNFLNENLLCTLLFDKYDKENFINNFRKAMEGGEEW